MPYHSIAEHRDTPLWRALESALTDLSASHEVVVNTAPEYVIEYFCRELTAKKLIVTPVNGSGDEG